MYSIHQIPYSPNSSPPTNYPPLISDSELAFQFKKNLENPLKMIKNLVNFPFEVINHKVLAVFVQINAFKQLFHSKSLLLKLKLDKQCQEGALIRGVNGCVES